MKHIPEHVRASWTDEQRKFYDLSYFEHPTGFGPEWITAHRSLEMQCDVGRRGLFLEYWPDEALSDLECFKRSHYDNPADTGLYALSSVHLRVKKFYPELFSMHLRPRIAPLEYLEDTHPDMYLLWKEFCRIDNSYHRKLHAAVELTDGIQNRKEREKERYRLYRLAFIGVYPELHQLLSDMAGMC